MTQCILEQWNRTHSNNKVIGTDWVEMITESVKNIYPQQKIN